MGRLRGKRNRDQDRYWTLQRRATQEGMLAAPAPGCCANCGQATPLAELYQGWCIPCVGAWTDTVDPWLIYQAQSKLPRAAVASGIMRQVETLQDRVIAPIRDEDFLPLTQFMGHKGIASQRAMWNYLQALYVFELQTTGEAFKLGVCYPHTLHLCGRHAPVQRLSLTGFLSRIHSAGTDFPLFTREPRFAEFIRDFIADNRLSRVIFTYTRSGVDVQARWALARSYARYGKPHFDKHAPTVWPFEGAYDGKQRERGELEELPDVLMQVGEMVPRGMPETLRQDLCQDLIVAVLSGETTLDELQGGNLRHYIREAFRHHPLRYGRYSLDQPVEWWKDNHLARAPRAWSNTAGWPVDPENEVTGWHHGRERPLGLSTIGDLLRQKHEGPAIQGPQVIVEAPALIEDESVAEIYYAETHPRR
jgi:hypothetical protein